MQILESTQISGRLNPMSNGSTSWVLSWDRVKDPRPKVEVLGKAAPKNLDIFELRDGLVAVFSGYLFDRKELCDRLKAGPGSSDATLIALAYESWGPNLFDRLRGGFILAVWDERKERLIVGRDAMGLHPCFYWRDSHGFVVSSSLDAVLAQRGVSGGFNRAVIAEHLEGAYSSHQQFETFYQEIRRIPPAHQLSLTRDGWEISRYWDPVPPGFDWAKDSEIGRFQPLLERAVGRCLSAGADSIALSGGFDSVGIAVLVADQLHGQNPPYAISLRFTDPLCDEGSTQKEVARTLGFPQLIQTLEESVEGKSPIEASLDLSQMSPCPVVSPWQAFYTGLFRSAPPDLAYLLMGTGGDDLLNVDVRYAADCLASGNFGGLWRFLRVCQRTSPFSAAQIARVVLWDGAIKPETRSLASKMFEQVSPSGKAWLRGKLRRPKFAHDDLLAALDDRRRTAPRINLAPGERSYVTAIRYLTQSPLLLHEFDQGFTWAQRLGFTLLYPYFDRDLTEILLRIHPEHLLAGGKAKAPLRMMVAERLPSVTLPAKKVDFGQMIHGMLRPQGRLKWQDMGGPDYLGRLAISDPSRLNSVMEGYFAGHNNNANLIWRILSTEMWLRKRSQCTNSTG